MIKRFAIPEDVSVGLMTVKEFDYAINIVMPKFFADFVTLNNSYSTEL